MTDHHIGPELAAMMSVNLVLCEALSVRGLIDKKELAQLILESVNKTPVTEDQRTTRGILETFAGMLDDKR